MKQSILESASVIRPVIELFKPFSPYIYFPETNYGDYYNYVISKRISQLQHPSEEVCAELMLELVQPSSHLTSSSVNSLRRTYRLDYDKIMVTIHANESVEIINKEDYWEILKDISHLTFTYDGTDRLWKTRLVDNIQFSYLLCDYSENASQNAKKLKQEWNTAHKQVVCV